MLMNIKTIFLILLVGSISSSQFLGQMRMASEHLLTASPECTAALITPALEAGGMTLSSMGVGPEGK